MTATDAMELVGKPYSISGLGPDAFNCWGLLCFVERQFFDRKVEQIDITDIGQCFDVFKTNIRGGQWLAASEPKHGDAVLLKGGSSPHVGVYLDIDGGGVLHSAAGSGVIFTDRTRLRLMGYSKFKAYRDITWQI